MFCIADTLWIQPDGACQAGSIVVTEEGIHLLPRDSAVSDCDFSIDGRDCLAVPGLVDPHTHMREPGQAYKEGITNGTRAALVGGVTTVLDMPNNSPPVTDDARLEAKRALFRRKSRVHWGLHVQASSVNALLDTDRIASVKVYMARSSTDSAINSRTRLREIFAAYPRVAVHAEDEDCFPESRAGPHHLARPREAVRSALRKLEDVLTGLSPEDRPRLILCHISTADELVWLRDMKAGGFDIWGETAPHYATFTQSAAVRAGSRLRVNPPIRRREDRAAIMAGILDGTIDFMGSDHAPHAPAEKNSRQPPSGLAGIEWFAPWLHSLLDRGRISTSRFLDLGVRNAARCYGLDVASGIEDGAPADLALIGPNHTRRVITRARWNPYGNRPLGRVVAGTVVRGRLAQVNGAFPESPRGKEVYE